MVANNELPMPGADVPVTMALVPLIAKEDVALHDLALRETLEVETNHHRYTLQNAGNGTVWIAGHPTYCPQPVLVDLLGASGEGQRFRVRGLCRGGRMEFAHPTFGIVRTSPITNIRQLATEASARGLKLTKAS